MTIVSSQHPRRRRTTVWAGAGDALRAHSRVVDTTADLLALLPGPEDTLTWVRQGEGIVGWGEAARFEPSGPDRFRLAADWWRSFADGVDVVDEVGLPGSGLVAFVSMAFADDPGDSVLVVPEIVVGRRNGVTWITEIGGDGPSRPTVHPVRPIRTPSAINYSGGQSSAAGYRAAVAKAVHRLRSTDLAKVVLSHDIVATVPDGDGPIDARYVLTGLADRYPNCYVFSVDGLLGATPELLLRRHGDTVSARVLAGTMWPTDGVDADALANRLLGSAKNQEEHRYAVDSLLATLRPYCAELAAPHDPEILVLPNVVHLATDIRGTLTDDVSLLTLTGAAHPTAAIGGTPKDAAVALIAELEGMDRGRYTGPVGWVDSTGDGEFGIALRCGQLDGNSVRLFAGGGIVADSDPDNEVAEAAAKFVPMREALEPLREG
ncbi:MAG TPA: isochorismate synthase [Pseudonocardiaceae bacterium]|nr:isochorismate synthase [Pseudonocardiaceae bacterium]